MFSKSSDFIQWWWGIIWSEFQIFIFFNRDLNIQFPLSFIKQHLTYTKHLIWSNLVGIRLILKQYVKNFVALSPYFNLIGKTNK